MYLDMYQDKNFREDGYLDPSVLVTDSCVENLTTDGSYLQENLGVEKQKTIIS
jgi:hypothetical protein